VSVRAGGALALAVPAKGGGDGGLGGEGGSGVGLGSERRRRKGGVNDAGAQGADGLTLAPSERFEL
jgi:hypothetical protein